MFEIASGHHHSELLENSMAEQASGIIAPACQDLTAADLNTSVNHEARVLDIRAAEVLGYERPADIRPLIERHIEALERLGTIIRTVRKNGKRGRPSAEFWLNKRQLLFVCTKAQTDRATDATIQMVEVFDAHLRGTLTPAKPVRVSEHRRAAPQPRAPVALPAPVITRDGLALIRIGTETLFVDTARIDPGPDDRVVCFDSDGAIGVEPVKMSWPHQNWGGRRFAHAAEARSMAGSKAEHRPGVWVIGVVVATLPEATSHEEERPKQISAGKRHPRRFEPGSDVKKDLLQLVRSAKQRMVRNKAVDLGQALTETLEDYIARENDPKSMARGPMLDWDRDRATEDLHRKLRAEGKDPAGRVAREVLH